MKDQVDWQKEIEMISEITGRVNRDTERNQGCRQKLNTIAMPVSNRNT
jgi:hypothetical protein